MRVLIADRNARLLEAIARSFAQQFSIQTATTHELCNELLLQGEFELAVISEKLADGRGLQLLGQIARDSPGTLRVLAARPSRLELLEGKLEPFGLFGTVSYPIDPREFLSVLTHAGEAVASPAGEASKVRPSAGRSAFERLSLTSADTLFASNVLTTISSMESARRSSLSARPQAASVGRTYGDQARAPSNRARTDRGSASRQQNVASDPPSNARRSRSAAPTSQNIGSQPTHAQATRAQPTQGQRTQAKHLQADVAQAQPIQAQLGQAQSAQAQPSQAQPGRAQSAQAQPAQGQPSQAQSARAQHSASRAAAARSSAPARSPSQSEAFQRAVARRRAGNRSGGSRGDSRPSQRAPAHRSPMRTKVVLAASIVAVFLVTTLTFNLLDAGVHVTQASAPRPHIEPAVSPPTESPPPADPSPAFGPAPQVAKRVEPRPAPPAAPQAEEDPAADPQVAAITGPVADPSSFGSEAYEPIYSN